VFSTAESIKASPEGSRRHLAADFDGPFNLNPQAAVQELQTWYSDQGYSSPGSLD